ncbi:jg2044 [Pararge aegeria aegeria]|uniref:Jg2044 protein n=1 Tax=Pararge aegeria aegeria TaxID=348720 RepID=A0A8S4R7J2_9NEOP|nr:jg2044 [Pararge aegeria aegeria]
MVSLIDENSPDGLTPYAKAVSTFAQINFTKQDCFPSNMCPKCLYLLKQAIQFKLVTESSDNCLKNLKVSVGDDSENLKENIIEFTMLKFYFPTECRKVTRECSKTKKKNEENSEVTQFIENNKNIVENQSTTNNSLDGDLFETHEPESETEQNISENEVKILDTLENLFSSNDCETPNSVQVFKRKKTVAKKKCFKPQKLQYQLAIKQRSIRRKLPSGSRVKEDLVCNVCDRVLANQLTYTHHMQRHTGCRYICEHCGKGFPVLNELQIHQVTKHGTGRYIQCKQCSFKAPRKFDLVEHERIHTGERPYTCDKCGLTFRRREIHAHSYHNHHILRILIPPLVTSPLILERGSRLLQCRLVYKKHPTSSGSGAFRRR